MRSRFKYGRWLIVLFLAAVCFSPTAALATNKGIEVPYRVEPNLITVSVTDGFVNYGVVELGTSKDTTTTGLGDFQTATNGNEIANFNIKSSDAVGGVAWTLAGTAAGNTFTHGFSLDDGGAWTLLTTTYQTLATGVGAFGTKTFDLQIGMPTTSTDSVEKTIIVTVQATL